jgi:hypothetical protein
MENTREKFVPFIIFLLLLLIYIGFPTKNYYWDGIEFAQIIENAGSLNTSLLHPSHLFYNVIGYIIYKCVLGLGIDARAVTVLQITNSVFSALSAFVLFHILKISFRSTYLAASLTLLFSFSALWWKFSTDADAYIPSVLFILISFYLILPNQKPRPLLVALIHTISMCFHQLGVFFFPVIVLGLFFQTSALPARKRLWIIAQYSGLAFILTFGLYYLSFYLQTGSLNFKSLFSWLTYYSTENGFLFSLKDCLKYTLNGEVKLFFGGRFNFLYEVINPLTIVLIGILILAFVGLAVQIIRIWKEKKVETALKTGGEYKHLLMLCAAWAGVYLIFLFFWIPQNTFYRMFYLPSFIILIGILLSRYKLMDKNGYRTMLFVIILAVSNFLFFIYPHTKVRKETPLSLAVQMNNIWSPKTVVYFFQMGSDNRLIQYFNRATTWIKLEADVKPEEFEAQIQKIYADGGEVWMETSALSQFLKQEEAAQWLQKHSTDSSRYKLNDPAYNVTLIKITP